LSRIAGKLVISRNTAFAYRNKTIGRALLEATYFARLRRAGMPEE
jgi:hypothetical protein